MTEGTTRGNPKKKRGTPTGERRGAPVFQRRFAAEKPGGTEPDEGLGSGGTKPDEGLGLSGRWDP